MGENKERLAVIEGPPATIAAYLYSNYKITHTLEAAHYQDQEYVGTNYMTTYCYIEGHDFAGFTLEALRERLESGLWFGLKEVEEIPPEAIEWEE